MQNNVVSLPQRPQGLKPIIIATKTEDFVSVNGYTSLQSKILSTTIDDVELEIDLATYDRMERDGTIMKCKQILLTTVLSDDLQMSPGATEDEVSKEEYDIYVKVMKFCESMVDGLDRPVRTIFEQLLGNAIRHGHGIAESVWEYRLEPEQTEAPKDLPKPSKFGAALQRLNFMSAAKTPVPDSEFKKPKLKETLRLMPQRIMVKPRGAARFVVDEFSNELGLVPARKTYNRAVSPNEIISRDKFLVLTLRKTDEDPRGNSFYRPLYNWYNLKAQTPAETLRLILEESVPKAVGTLPEEAVPYEYERDSNNNIIYEDPETRKTPKQLTAVESMTRQMEGFRGGSGVILPYGATLEPFKKNSSNEAAFMQTIIKMINTQMEDAILNQTLAQSEGEHQARSASQQVAEILYSLGFWIRWLIAVMVSKDLLEVGVRANFGDWAVRYLPMVSLGDFVRRDWAHDLEVISKAYFQGFIDDTQRAELMAWMNLPKPGPSRQEQMQDALAVPDVNGEPAKPNNGRPDKQPSNKDRNTGNGTPKKGDNSNGSKQRNANNGWSPLNLLGHHRGWSVRSKRNISPGS